MLIGGHTMRETFTNNVASKEDDIETRVNFSLHYLGNALDSLSVHSQFEN